MSCCYNMSLWNKSTSTPKLWSTISVQIDSYHPWILPFERCIAPDNSGLWDLAFAASYILQHKMVLCSLIFISFKLCIYHNTCCNWEGINGQRKKLFFLSIENIMSNHRLAKRNKSNGNDLTLKMFSSNSKINPLNYKSKSTPN